MRTVHTPARRSASKHEVGRSQITWLLALGLVPLAALLLYITFTWHSLDRPPYLFGALILLASSVAWLAGSAFARHRLQAPLGILFRSLQGTPSTRAEITRLRGDVGELARTFEQMTHTIASYERDATARDKRMDRLTRAYVMMSGINDLVHRTRDRDMLCTEVCRLAVERGGFCFAWIGLYEPTTAAVDLRWHAGEVDGMFQRLHAATTGDQFTPAFSIRGGEMFVCNDLTSDVDLVAIHQTAIAQGVRSFALLPLRVDGDVMAVLALYANTAGYFMPEENHVLNDIATDAALCLGYIEKEETLHQLAYYDGLTTLPNLVLFTDRLDQALAREIYTARHVALIMGHIDRFKELNTAFGHRTGDAVLQEIARRLSRTVRPGDTIARTGGAGFGIILTDVAQPGDVALVARKIAQIVAGPIAIDEREIFVTLGMGIAISPEDGQTTETLMTNANTAQHMLDNEARTRYRFYTPEIDAQVRERYAVERELHRALERNEFTLYYQPIVNLRTLRVTGSEALLRWHNPGLGPIPPGTFIPIAERSGLIVPIGEWVLKTAYAQARLWKMRGLPAQISVNASAIQLKERDFDDRAQSILTDIDANQGVAITLEITETNLMENPERAATQLHRLRERGLSISIDDFGTGYSSLSYLRRLPVDSLKIDISFVHDLTDGPDGIAIVRAIIALAHSLELTVIAEGVETREQLQILRDARCDAAQGYLFSPAVPADQFEALCHSSFKFDTAAPTQDN